MVKAGPAVSWRQARRESARGVILECAWAAVREEGLGGLSLRDLARRSGITTPTVYSYFDSKHGIYDAMFGQAAEEFATHMLISYDDDEPRRSLVVALHRFVEFCTDDLARYQLLFQRTIPGFEPSPASFAPAVRALDVSRKLLARNGVTHQRHLDVWTALTTGLVNQQIANDPGGTRWVRLIDDLVAMFLDYYQEARPRAPRRPTSTSKARKSRP